MKDQVTEIVIEKADIHSKEAAELINELSETLNSITGNSGRGSFDNSDMTIFVIAREAGKAVGCGASREISQDTAEIKRMYARKISSGIGKSILNYLEAKENGFRRIILETRKCNEKAVEFYLYNGYKVIPSYGKYEKMPEAICFEKQL